MFIEKLWSGCLSQFGHFLQFCRFNPPETFRPPTHTQTHHFSPGSKIAFFCIHWRREKKKEIDRIKWTSLFCKDSPALAYFISTRDLRNNFVRRNILNYIYRINNNSIIEEVFFELIILSLDSAWTSNGHWEIRTHKRFFKDSLAKLNN